MWKKKLWYPTPTSHSKYMYFCLNFLVKCLQDPILLLPVAQQSATRYPAKKLGALRKLYILSEFDLKWMTGSYIVYQKLMSQLICTLLWAEIFLTLFIHSERALILLFIWHACISTVTTAFLRLWYYCNWRYYGFWLFFFCDIFNNFSKDEVVGIWGRFKKKSFADGPKYF